MHGQKSELSGNVFLSFFFLHSLSLEHSMCFLDLTYFSPPFLFSNLFCKFLRFVEGS